ncbi:MAG: hypothetical protein DWI02_11895 [Planctomycetota bacterium]|nr:MAG: hypothetical protein DWI02_11895 [Planctomycetota bacterium]
MSTVFYLTYGKFFKKIKKIPASSVLFSKPEICSGQHRTRTKKTKSDVSVVINRKCRLPLPHVRNPSGEGRIFRQSCHTRDPENINRGQRDRRQIESAYAATKGGMKVGSAQIAAAITNASRLFRMERFSELDAELSFLTRGEAA